MSRVGPTPLSLLLAVALGLFAAPAAAQTPVCDGLTEEQQATARGILSSQHAYDCCDDTLAACLEATPRCRLVVRVANDICRRVQRGQQPDAIVRTLERRARTMISLDPPAKIDLEGWEVVGDPAAPVVVVEYACARCPFCAKQTPALQREVADGELAGKVALYLKPFPIRSHPHSREGGLALMAAARLGKLWPYVMELYADFDDFAVDKLPEYAVAAGLDRDAFVAATAETATRDQLVASKKEGLRLGVDATPTLFLNGRKYEYDLDHHAVVDALLEEHERVTGKRYQPTP